MSKKNGINPVTIHSSRSDCPLSLTVGRLWVSREPNEPWIKNLVVCLYDPAHPEDDAIVMTTVDEDHFIDAMGHLFPNGELMHCNEELDS